MAGKHLARGIEPSRYVSGGTFLGDHDAVNAGRAPGLLRLGDECGLALLTKPPGEAVRGQPPDWRPRPDEHAASMLGNDQALRLETLKCIADRHPGHAIVRYKLSLGG